MAKKISQFRYYSETDANVKGKNYPAGISRAKLASGSIFFGYTPITQLGIQTLPGTKFYLNNNTSPIIIGSTGIYEVNLEGLSEITSLSFDPASIQSIDKNNNAYLIIDFIHEGSENG